MPVDENAFSLAAKGFFWAVERAFLLGLQASTGGNISLRLGADHYLTKPTGLGLTECEESSLVIVDGTGRPVKGTSRPTKEVGVHMAIFRNHPEVNAVVHYHSPFATAYAVRGKPFPLPTVHSRRILKKVPLAAEHPEGSAALEHAVTKSFDDGDVKAVLLAGHGVICVGPAIEQAQFVAELMEECAKIQLLSERIP